MDSSAFLVVFVGLTIMSAVMLIAALVWVLIDSGKKSNRDDSAAGSDILGDDAADDWEEPLLQKKVFKGQARSIEGETSFSFTEIKKLVRNGQWREVLPVLLAVSGILGLLFFGSLALYMALDNKLLGVLIAAVAIFSVLRVLIRIVQA